jgi:hypothetical protein
VVYLSGYQTASESNPSLFFFLQSKAPNEIHAILTETLGENAL